MTDQTCSHENSSNRDEGSDRVLRCDNPECGAELARTRRDPNLD